MICPKSSNWMTSPDTFESVRLAARIASSNAVKPSLSLLLSLLPVSRRVCLHRFFSTHALWRWPDFALAAQTAGRRAAAPACLPGTVSPVMAALVLVWPALIGLRWWTVSVRGAWGAPGSFMGHCCGKLCHLGLNEAGHAVRQHGWWTAWRYRSSMPPAGITLPAAVLAQLYHDSMLFRASTHSGWPLMHAISTTAVARGSSRLIALWALCFFVFF